MTSGTAPPVEKPVLRHQCFAIGCQEMIALNLLMCGEHWSKVPAYLKGSILKFYRPGKRPTREYTHACMKARGFVQAIEREAT